MTLHLIGIGLADAKDISLRGLEVVKRCHRAYLESYTSTLACGIDALERLYGKKVIPADRNLVEQEQPFLEEAKNRDVALLIVGDVFSATTHISIFQEARKKGIDVKIINNASVLNAVGVTGLELYKFGRVTSIPFENENVKAPYHALEMNKKNGLHTLFLLDLDPQKNRYLTIRDAIAYLLALEKKENKKIISSDTPCIGCARLGSEDFSIKAAAASKLLAADFGKPPFCLIIPGKLHFVEEEAVEMWKAQMMSAAKKMSRFLNQNPFSL